MASCIRASGAAPEPISVERARRRERLPRDAAGGLAALLQVLLVVVLGSVEGGRRDDLGDDRAAEGPPALQLPLRVQGRRLLLGIVKEDRRAVLRADVRSLAIRGRGIVILPEDPQQVLVGGALGVVLHLHRLPLAGAAGPHVLIGGVRHAAPRVSDRGRQHAGHGAERRLDSPEAARRKRRRVLVHGCRSLPFCRSAAAWWGWAPRSEEHTSELQ